MVLRQDADAHLPRFTGTRQRELIPIDRLFSIGPTTCQIKFRLIHIERRTGAAALGSGNGTFLVTIPCFKPPLGRFLHRVRVRALTSQTRSLANS